MLAADELQRAAVANPFRAACADPKTLHLYVLVQHPERPDLEAMEALAAPGESVRLIGVAATARNWRAVATLLEMTGRPA